MYLRASPPSYSGQVDLLSDQSSLGVLWIAKYLESATCDSED